MIGKTISHYKLLEKIGGGGMGVVYKAEDIKLKRTVALKFLPQDLTRNAVAKRRFIKEAQTTSALGWQRILHCHLLSVISYRYSGMAQTKLITRWQAAST